MNMEPKRPSVFTNHRLLLVIAIFALPALTSGCTNPDSSASHNSHALSSGHEQHQWAYASADGGLLVPPGEEATLTGVTFGQAVHLRLAFVGPAMTAAAVRLKHYGSYSDFANDTNGQYVGASRADWQFDTNCSPGEWCDHGAALPTAITSDHNPLPGYAFEQDGTLTWNPPTSNRGDENNFHLRYVGASAVARDYWFRYVIDGVVMPYSNMHYNQNKPAMLRTAPCTSLLDENFEPYTVGTFPSSGGWVLTYNGTGDAFQYVDNTFSVSPTKSLHLQGNSCWAAWADRPIANMPTQVVVKNMVRLAPGGGGGCDPKLAAVSLRNPSENSWGGFYGYVTFDSDGNIRAWTDVYAGTGVVLMAYTAGTWYEVTMYVKLASRKYDVYIDGILRGSNLDILGVNSTPSHLGVTGAFLATAWHDDVRVCQP